MSAPSTRDSGKVRLCAAALNYTSPTPATDALTELARLHTEFQTALEAMLRSFDCEPDQELRWFPTEQRDAIFAARQAWRALDAHREAFQ